MKEGRWERVLETIGIIHRAGLAPETWPEALQAVAGCLDARRAVMFGADLGSGAVSGLRTYNIDPDATGRFAAYYHRLDPWLQGFDPAWRARQPIRGTYIVPDSILRRGEYYNDFIKPLDMRFALTGFPLKSAQWMDVLTVFRGVRQADFDDESPRMYRIILEHAAQALEVQRTIGALNARARGLAAALEEVPRAALLLDRRRRVIYANPAADALLAAGDGLSVCATACCRPPAPAGRLTDYWSALARWRETARPAAAGSPPFPVLPGAGPASCASRPWRPPKTWSSQTASSPGSWS